MAMTPEQKARKAARERERYAKARSAGFTPDEARSIQKALRNQPELLQEPSEQLLDLVGDVRGLADSLTDFVDGLFNFDTKKKRPAKGRTSGQGKRSLPNPAGGTRKRGRTSGSRDTFADFVARNPDKKGNQLIREWRAKGGKVGNERGKDIIRQTRQAPKQFTKRTRLRYLSPAEVQKDFYKRYQIPNRYIYLVRYEVEREDQADTYDDYLHIKSDTPLNMREIREATEQAWEDGLDSASEKYKAVSIVPGSIQLIYAIDQNK